ncbi:MAG: hypothetical protein FD126_2698 [Elusimicrobia bacterium]|nr:MAG: hypothetical protein FD126_2698 [Elusimicrobiota bacterium]
MEGAEIDDKANSKAGSSQIAEALRFVDRQDACLGLNFHDDLMFNDDVSPHAACHRASLVLDLEWDLPFYNHPPGFKLHDKS